MRSLVVVSVMFCFSLAGFCAVYYVPDDYTAIQGAIDASSSGDHIIVRAGTYHENINYLGKNLTIESESGPDVTIIDGGQVDSVVIFESGEGEGSILRGFHITNGYAETGGGIRCMEDTSPKIVDNIISGNRADKFGAGIYCETASPTITRNVISDNTTEPEFAGGGICCWNYCSATIDGNTIASNSSNGIFCFNEYLPFDNVPIITITNNIIEDNTCTWYGGGIHCYCARANIMDNTISRNSAASYGGGIYLFQNGSCVVNNTISGNSSGTSGGGISCRKGGPMTIIGNAITVNSSEGRGGGIAVQYECTAVIIHNTISGNTTTSHGGGIQCGRSLMAVVGNTITKNGAEDTGGGIQINKAAPGIGISNNTILKNTAGNEGGGISCIDHSDPIITNTIFWGNSASKGPAIYTENSNPVVHHCDVEGGWPGSGNIDIDPLFVNYAGEDYHLTWTSPCIDTGDNNAVLLTDDDFEGDPRIAWGGTVDMGADEFYTHLYCMGDFTPGGAIEGKLVGLPGTSPVGLLLGSDVLDPSQPTMWGNFHLQAPWRIFPLGPIPGSGVLVIPETIPPRRPAPYDLPMQALIGLNPDSLTNLFVLEVR